jgi:tRNA 2-selenouridine synthase
VSLRRVTVAQALADQAMAGAGFNAVIDVRSESEFADDHLPSSENWPVLNDAERAEIGTEYKQVSPFAARKRGAALVSRNIARHIESSVLARDRDWKPLVYCWRGGQRSGALATVLDHIGFSVSVLDGGYREFRRRVLADLDVLPQRLTWRVICGATGSAKSRLLRAMAEQDAQVLDLEALACHRGSVLGPEPDRPQPSQKSFETAIWQRLNAMAPERPVFVEGESRTIGRLRLPERVVERLRGAPCTELQMAMPQRVAFLLDDYAHFLADAELLCERLRPLRELRGAATVERWQKFARDGRFHELVEELLDQHYDPAYRQSMRRNFAELPSGTQFALKDGSADSLTAAARELLSRTG